MDARNFLLLTYVAIQAASATTISYTGSLASSTDVATITVTMPVAGSLKLQTWGFGGGTNADSSVIPAGGFDRFVGVFSGVGPSATFIDGTSDVLSNYAGFAGCPPAATVNIGGPVCGDVSMTFSLGAGSYTVLLTDGPYVPNAVFETNGTLGDGFSDFTGGAFQTCNETGCVTGTANWALDITTPSAPAPEPVTLWICGASLLLLSRRMRSISK